MAGLGTIIDKVTRITTAWLQYINDTVYGLAETTDDKGDALVISKQTDGGTARTLHARVGDLRYITDYGGIVADGTDQTAAIVTWLGTLSSSLKQLYVVPPNCYFTPSTVIAAMPVGVVFLDLSCINDFSSAGETTKAVGVLSKDTGVSDTHWRVGSGHHAIITLNNYGNAGTTSASERKGSIVWAAGQYALGTAAKRGFRFAALQQFTKDPGSNVWTWGVRSLAPWVSIAGDYEIWAQGQVIASAGVYRVHDDNHYVSASAGTTGASPPVHTSGTVSDGGVLWTWIDSSDRTVFAMTEQGRFLIGNGTLSATWRHKVSIVDPNGYLFEGVATGTSRNAELKLIPTNGAAAEVATPFFRAQDASGLRVMKSDASTDIGSFNDAQGFLQRETCAFFSAAADLDTTPSVAGVRTLYLQNTGATNLTALDDGDDGQEVELISINSNTTLVNSANFTLTGSVNVALTAWSSVTMRKIPTTITGNRWVEVARSVK